MSGPPVTKGTEVAALEARRNELVTRAEGAFLGERRAAIARLAMIVMFAIVVNVGGGRSHRAMPFVGGGYLLWCLLTAIAVHRRTVVTPRRTFWWPLLLTAIDFSFVTTMSLLSQSVGGPFSAARHAIASAIIISFAVARQGLHHVAFGCALAIASFLFLAIYADAIDDPTSWFVMAGYAVLGFMIAITNLAVTRMFRSIRQRDNLTRFLPRQVAERILASGPEALAPVEREVTVLFSDIRGFTTMSEGLSPREVLAMLDDYFGQMSQIVKGHDGVVGKFLGDGMLAFWGVPDRVDDHATAAVRAARDMRRAVRELNQHREARGQPPLQIGIGIHTGTVAAGMLGGALQAEYTIIGDAVNVASRVEGLTKEHGVDVLVSETTWLQLPEPRRGERLATVPIRGRKEPVVLYTIDSSAATVEVIPQRV